MKMTKNVGRVTHTHTHTNSLKNKINIILNKTSLLPKGQ